jgi:hypothetical protein
MYNFFHWFHHFTVNRPKDSFITTAQKSEFINISSHLLGFARYEFCFHQLSIKTHWQIMVMRQLFRITLSLLVATDSTQATCTSADQDLPEHLRIMVCTVYNSVSLFEIFTKNDERFYLDWKMHKFIWNILGSSCRNSVWWISMLFHAPPWTSDQTNNVYPTLIRMYPHITSLNFNTKWKPLSHMVVNIR